MTGGCAAEEVLLDIADRVARPPASMVAARARLALLAGRLPAPAGPAADLAAVARLLEERLPGPGPILLPDALRAGRAHPLAAAAAGVAVARRAGLAVDVVGNGDRVWLGVVAARAERAGDLDLALRVVRARMALPVEDPEVAAVRARMN